MGKFVEKYVKTPLREVDDTYKGLQTVLLVNTAKEIQVQVGDNSFSISRSGAKLDYEAINNADLMDE